MNIFGLKMCFGLGLMLFLARTSCAETDAHVRAAPVSEAAASALTEFCEEKIGRTEVTLTKDVYFPSSRNFNAVLIDSKGGTALRSNDRDLRIPVKGRACEIYLKKASTKSKSVKLKAGKTLKFSFCKDGISQTGIETNFSPSEGTFLVIADDPDVEFIKCYQRTESGIVYPPMGRPIEGSGLRSLLSTFTDTPK